MEKLWFKRKLYGWGWYPSSWEGWVVTLIYVALIVLFASTLDENSSPREFALMFFLPLVILSSAFIRIAYKKGESPRWQWGKDSSNK